MEKGHECYIGIFYDYEDTALVTVDNYIEVTSFSDQNIDQLLNNPNSHFRKFDYCPICGKKLDWDEIKETLNFKEKIWRK